mmetsp:Transcript_28505/g.73878  ORF Transcript_28505/g.73878 Transcript_28505/m.73878 type:complete len:421 (-) Transcript_28505:110-1372(-)
MAILTRVGGNSRGSSLSSASRVTLLIAAVLLAPLAIGGYMQMFQNLSGRSHSSGHYSRYLLRVESPRSSETGSVAREEAVQPETCSRKLVSYIPSKLEQRWKDNIRTWQTPSPAWEAPCAAAVEDRPEFDRWIAAILERRGSKEDLTIPMDEAIFSRHVWRDNCTGEHTTTYIEPLAESLRSPHFYCFPNSDRMCITADPVDCHKPEPVCASEPGGCEKYSAMSTSYLLVPAQDTVSRVAPGGTHFFFDLGSTWYNAGVAGERDSQKWFKETYERRGVEFDHILAWEARPVDHPQYWSVVPVDVATKLVFYNTPAVTTPGHAQNPMTHILKRTRPSDYVVLKLDIDATEVESAFIQQLLSDPELLARVDEVYWEHHVQNHPLANNPGEGWSGHPLDGDIAHSYDVFTLLRQKGVKAHSWI